MAFPVQSLPIGELPTTQVNQSHGNSGDEGFTFGSLFQILAPFLKVIVGLLTTLLLVAAGSLYLGGGLYVLPFIVVAGAAMAAIWIYLGNYRNGVPYLYFFIIQQGLIYLLPLYISNAALKDYHPEIIMNGAISLAIFFIFLVIGCRSGSQKAKISPSKWNISREVGTKSISVFMRISIIMLQFNIGALLFMEYGNIGSLYSVLSAMMNSAGTLGALLGGYAMGTGKRNSPAYWILIVIIFLLNIRDLTISAGEQLLLASIFGLMLGSRKIPWAPILVTLAVVSLLSAGKFVMRDKYWTMDNQTHVPLTSLPAFYAEWSAASIESLTGAKHKVVSAREVEGAHSQSFGERINNYHSLAFVIRAEQEKRIPPLYGKTYSLIPPLFLPRFFWPDKPRTHASQDLLNVYFQRQRPEDIEWTFVAWGFLPEAIGDFGVWLGPVFLGFVIGFALGYVETWSIQKQLFSIEGFAIFAFLMQLVISWEHCSSLFLTATFQMMVIVVTGGLFLRSSLGGGNRGASALA